MKVFRNVPGSHSLIPLLLILIATPVHAAKKKKGEPAADASGAAAASSAANAAAEEGESVDVSKITEKYWAQGKESELGVVQNRKFTSAERPELQLFTGTFVTDPFLSVKRYGVSLGYNFNQYLSVHALWWRAVSSGSDALTRFEASLPGSTIDTNMPEMYYGLQANYNILYGKASLFGSAIIYVDVYFLGGVGINDTETGNYFAPFIGIGQKIHLNKFMALNLDYRLMRFNETIRAKTRGSNQLGATVGERGNTTDAVTLGICFFY